MDKSAQQKFSQGLLRYLNNSPTAYHAVENAAEILRENGFQELKETAEWSLEQGGRYYVTKNGSCIIAFTTGEGSLAESGFRIIGAHTDSPGFKIKPGSCIVTPDGYVKINVEVYGGVILSTWFDRPLALAGRVIVKEGGTLKEKLVRIHKPVLMIPNLCIHFHRDVNDKCSYNKQTDMLPLLSMKEENMEKGDYLLNILEEETGIGRGDVLDYELFLYEYQEGIFTGRRGEFISASRIDDLALVYAGLTALTGSKDGGNACKVFAAFDNEEVGSASAQGARSGILLRILDRICKNLGLTEEACFRAIANSTSVSADTAHAVHPNYSDKHDPECRPVLGGGPVVKYSASQRYGTTAFSAAYFMEACGRAGVPCQKFVNRNDTTGGSTIGPFLSSLTTIPTVDIGIPVLAMHSVREFGAVMDNVYTEMAFQAYFGSL
ncbi:MAG: M18 family aminopeptidase [Lachnospiraceae bacterium]|nr:M18 family aminopeptidase [Butyrivibrio sp.]MCM1343560.1 M18 family aminopeptidase [Muribaculaceae bacterium]MCM1411568.1 M18 family aminopeptidase [Lachnospiraceae bacterium]